MAILTTTQNGLDFIGGTTYIQTGGTTLMSIAVNGNIAFNQYGAGTLVTDASGNITASSGGGAGGPYLPLSAGSGFPLTGDLYLKTASNQGNLFFGTADASYKIFGGGTYGYMGYNTGGYHRFLLSGTEKMRITSGGNVGIGTTSPLAKLVVNGVSDTAGTGVLEIATSTTNLKIGGATTYSYIQSHSSQPLYLNVLGNNVIMNPTAGNVGIGVTSTASKLKVSGSNTGAIPLVDLVASGTGTFQRGVRLLNGGMNVGDHIMYAIGYADSSKNMGQTYFYYAGDGSTSNRISMGMHGVNDVFNILGTGNVGIGTTSPGTTLDVAGNVSLANYAGTAENKTILAQNSYGQVASGIRSGVPYFGSISPLNLDIYTGNSSKIRIENSTGNVGIGTTLPNAKLEVNSSITFSSVDTFGQLVVKAASGSTGDMLNIGVDTANSVAFIQAVERGVNTIPLSLQRYGGNVGIGTTSPSALLEIQTASTSGSQDMQIFSRGVSPNYEVLKISRSAGSTEFLANQNITLSADYDDNHTSADSNIIFKVDGDEHMRIIPGGNVGIGVTNPSSKLTIESEAGKGTIELLAANAATTTNKIIFSELVLGDESFFIEHDGSGAGAANILKIHGDGSGGTAGGITIQRDGLVGIGTDSPGAKLDVQGSILVGAPSVSSWGWYIDKAVEFKNGSYIAGRTDVTPAINIGVNNYLATSQWEYYGTGTATRYNQQSGVHKFYTAISGTIGNTVTWQTSMTIDASSNVGIGVTGPTAKLDVRGNGYFLGTAASGAALVTIENNSGSTATSYGLLVIGGGNSSNGRTFEVRDGSGNVDLIVKGNGNVGIGGSTNNTSKLNLLGALAFENTSEVTGIINSDIEFIDFRAGDGVTISDTRVLRLTDVNAIVTGTCTATNFILSSDETLKNNIKEIESKHIDVNWKNFELKSEPGVKRSGVIAQELEKKHPEFVRTNDEGLKSVAYIDLLISKIAELEARLEKAGI